MNQINMRNNNMLTIFDQLNLNGELNIEELMEKHMEIINNIISKTPIYELTCNISREAVDLVKDTVFPEEKQS